MIGGELNLNITKIEISKYGDVIIRSEEGFFCIGQLGNISVSKLFEEALDQYYKKLG
jgi:hypothetical protein